MKPEQRELLLLLANAYADWCNESGTRFVDEEELEEELEDGLDSESVWTYQDFFDVTTTTLPSGERVNYSGAGYYRDIISDEESYAVKPSIQPEGSMIYAEVKIFCQDCSSDNSSNGECEFCKGEKEVWFDLNADGTFTAGV